MAAKAKKLVWTWPQQLALVVQSAATTPLPTAAGPGTAFKQMDVYNKISAALKQHDAFKSVRDQLDGAKVKKKLTSIISKVANNTWEDPSGAGGEELSQFADHIKTLREAGDSKEAKATASTKEHAWKDALDVLAETWAAAIIGNTINRNRIKVAQLAIAEMRKVKAGVWGADGNPVFNEAARWNTENDEPEIADLKDERLAAYVAQIPAAAKKVEKKRSRKSGSSSESDSSLESEGSSTATAGGKKKKKKRTTALSSSQQSADSLAKAMATAAQTQATLIAALTAAPPAPAAIPAGPAPARGCSRPGCPCNYTRIELHQEGIALDADCPACHHPRCEH